MQKEKFNHIYRTYSTKLYNYALWLTRNREASSDIIQTVFIRFWNKPIHYCHDAELESWLFTVTRTTCMDHFRKCARHSKLRLKYGEETPPAKIESQEDREIWQLLDDLSEKERSVLYLRFRIGHSFKDIANMLELKETAVRVCSFRALEKLREKYEEELK